VTFKTITTGVRVGVDGVIGAGLGVGTRGFTVEFVVAFVVAFCGILCTFCALFKKARAGVIVNAVRTMKIATIGMMRFIGIAALCNVDICHQISTYLLQKIKKAGGCIRPGCLQKLKHDICKIHLTRARECR
jgi:hypothetical protein